MEAPVDDAGDCGAFQFWPMRLARPGIWWNVWSALWVVWICLDSEQMRSGFWFASGSSKYGDDDRLVFSLFVWDHSECGEYGAWDWFCGGDGDGGVAAGGADVSGKIK